MPDEPNQTNSNPKDNDPLQEKDKAKETDNENDQSAEAKLTVGEVTDQPQNTKADEKTPPESEKPLPELETEISEAVVRERLKVEEQIPDEDKKRILRDIENGMALWHKMANQLNLALIVLGATAVFCSLYITAFAGSCALSTLGIRILSFISALCLTTIEML